MPTPVTDPALLAQLNGTGPQPVTDPAILAQLNGPQHEPYLGLPGTEFVGSAGTEKAAEGAGRSFVRGAVVDPAQGLTQLAAHGAGLVSPAAKEFAGRVDDYVNKDEAAYQAKQGEMGEHRFDASRLLGNVMSPFNAGVAGQAGRVAEVIPTALGRTLTRGALTGAGMSAGEAVHDAKDYWGTKGEQTAFGAATGAVVEPAAAALGRMVQGVSNPQKRILLDEGVPLTTGQMLANDEGGGLLKRLEDKAISIPAVGDMIHARQTEASLGLNRAALDRVLEPFGETLPHNVPMGREALDHVSQRASQGFEDALTGMHGQLDHQLNRDLAAIRTNAARALPVEQQRALDRLHDTIVGIFDSHATPGQFSGVLPGNALKGIDTHLGEEARGLASDTAHYNRRLGAHVEYTRDAYRDMINRVNTGQQSEALAQANRAWANWVRVRDAAATGGASNGIFSPAQLDRSVQRNARTTGQAVRGDALMQDLSDAGRRFLPPGVPNSGTADRHRMVELILGLAGGHAVGVPVSALATGAAGLGAYTGTGQAMARAIMAGGPETRAALAEAMRHVPFTRAAVAKQDRE